MSTFIEQFAQLFTNIYCGLVVTIGACKFTIIDNLLDEISACGMTGKAIYADGKIKSFDGSIADGGEGVYGCGYENEAVIYYDTRVELLNIHLTDESRQGTSYSIEFNSNSIIIHCIGNTESECFVAINNGDYYRLYYPSVTVHIDTVSQELLLSDNITINGNTANVSLYIENHTFSADWLVMLESLDDNDTENCAKIELRHQKSIKSARNYSS